MGCGCCRMIKSYIYYPSGDVDVPKIDSTSSSHYQPHQRTGGTSGSDLHGKQKKGFHNLGYHDSTLKLEFDNNHVNHRLHAVPPLAKELHQQASAPPTDGGIYIIQPEVVGPHWVDRGPSQVPVYPNIQNYENQRSYSEQEDGAVRNGWDTSITQSKTQGKSPSVDEIDEGVGGTPDYLVDTGDESSILSVDIHTSTNSLSSGGTRDELTLPKTLDVSTEESGISVTKSKEDAKVRNETEDVQSVTDSMVAEALAALEAATAGEDYE